MPGNDPGACRQYAQYWLDQVGIHSAAIGRLTRIPDYVPDMGTLPPAATETDDDDTINTVDALEAVRAGLCGLVACRECLMPKLKAELDQLLPPQPNNNTPD